MKIHSFYIEDAEKHGVEKAVILYNLRFWLEKNKANEKNLHDGYYWTYNSAKAFAALFPYYNASKIHRLLTQLENDGLVLSGNYNKAGYDRTKWYSMPEFSAASPENSHFSLLQNAIFHFCKMEFSLLQNAFFRSEEPIPDSKPNDKPDSKPDSNNDGESKPKATKYKPVKPELVSEQIWNDLLILRKETKASNSKTAWTTVFNGLEKAQKTTGHTLDEIITFWISKGWKGFNADWYLNAQPKPQQTNYQGHNHANNQPASNQPRPSHYDDLRAQIAAKYGTSEQPRDIRTVSETT